MDRWQYLQETHLKYFTGTRLITAIDYLKTKTDPSSIHKTGKNRVLEIDDLY